MEAAAPRAGTAAEVETAAKRSDAAIVPPTPDNAAYGALTADENADQWWRSCALDAGMVTLDQLLAEDAA